MEDKTNKLIGFNRLDADNERNYFNNIINQHLTPLPNLKIDFIRYEIRGKERFIIKVEVFQAQLKPVILKYKGLPTIYMRRCGFTNGATYEEIINMSIAGKKVQYDLMSAGIKYEKEKFSTLFDYYKKENNQQLSDKMLSSMGFFDENNILTNGALFFQDDYSGGKTDVWCSLFPGFNKGSGRIISMQKASTNILNSIQFVLDFVGRNSNLQIIKTTTGRENIFAYPPRALLEGVVNAVAHRDYYIDGSQVQIDIFKDRLEISSPGAFYCGINIKKTYNLEGIISKRRNVLISDILTKCNLTEGEGRWFDKISESYKDKDKLHKPYIYSTSDHFTLVLPDLTYEPGMNDDLIPDLVVPKIENSTVFDSKVLEYCYFKARKTTEIADYLRLSNSSYLRKQILENLVEQNYLLQDKKGNAAIYKTNEKKVQIL